MIITQSEILVIIKEVNATIKRLTHKLNETEIVDKMKLYIKQIYPLIKRIETLINYYNELEKKEIKLKKENKK